MTVWVYDDGVCGISHPHIRRQLWRASSWQRHRWKSCPSHAGLSLELFEKQWLLQRYFKFASVSVFKCWLLTNDALLVTQERKKKRLEDEKVRGAIINNKTGDRPWRNVKQAGIYHHYIHSGLQCARVHSRLEKYYSNLCVRRQSN